MFTLGRKIDINYKTNKIILIVSLLVSIVGYFMTRDIKSALYIGVGTFITWALAREVDPKHEYSAFVAAGISLINLFYYNGISLLDFLWILLLLRLITGITGREITIVDTLIVFGLTVFLTISNKNFIYIIPFMVGIILLVKYGKKSKINLGFLVLSSLIFLVEGLFFKYYYVENLNSNNIITIISILLPLIYIFTKKFIKMEKLENDKGGPANKDKVRNSQTLYGIIIMLMVIFSRISLSSVIIHLSVISGIIIFSLIFSVFKSNN